LQCVEDLAVLLARFREDVLGREEAMWHKMPEPVRDVDNIVVPFLLVHGGHDSIHLGVNGIWFPFCQYRSPLLRVDVALRWFRHPTIMTRE
jgi:hypothetical protein